MLLSMRILLSLAFSLVLASPLLAETLFSFGGDMVSEAVDSGLVPQQRYDQPAKGDSRIYIGGPGETIFLGRDLEIQGGVEVVKKDSFIDGGQAQCEVVDDGAADYLRLRFQTPPGVTQARCTALVWWPVEFAYGNLARILALSEGGISGSVTSRIVLRDAEGQFYVSSESITGGNGQNSWGIPNPAAASWTIWKPAEADWTNTLDTSGFNDYLRRDSKITGVGWLATATVDDPQGKRYGSNVTISEFAVETAR